MPTLGKILDAFFKEIGILVGGNGTKILPKVQQAHPHKILEKVSPGVLMTWMMTMMTGCVCPVAVYQIRDAELTTLSSH